MKLLVTGANGFIGKNLMVHLQERQDIDVTAFTRSDTEDQLVEMLRGVDGVIHLAGINRPQSEEEFVIGNADLTVSLASAVQREVERTGKPVPVVYTSSIQAERDTPYGQSKLAAEKTLFAMSENTKSPVYVYRLANVFGKWCKPNYNSMVATFCHNIIRDLPIQIHNEHAEVQLVYIDDVVSALLGCVTDAINAVANGTTIPSAGYRQADPVYTHTVGYIAEQLRAFKDSRESLISERVGTGFTRKLYSTYVSYLPTEKFTYQVPKYGDARGVFVEMLKTPDAGQFSYFTAHPGVTRGGHYHHTKTEKFLVIKGTACFRFRHMVTGEFYELFTSGEQPEIVETVPGWSHDITNVGNDEMIVMLWANEIFDRQNPDTFAAAVGTA